MILINENVITEKSMKMKKGIIMKHKRMLYYNSKIIF